MNNPSVTIVRKEGYATAAVSFGMAVLIAFLNTVMPSAKRDEWILGYAIAAIAVVLAVAFLLWARCTETIDENGICIRRPFSQNRYPWDAVQRVGIIPPPGKDFPKIEIRVADRRSPLLTDYTKRSLACIRHYYGQPDFDEWGQPPTIS